MSIAGSYPAPMGVSFTTYLKYGAIAFIAIAHLLWAYENITFMKSASPRATRACAGKTGFFDGPNSYYWCLRRVEAGGKP